jgi:class 3 adenylate cyclase/tetratricopeptide (TPR) repeat protein/DNA-binding XRE family transcriptional regulator
MVKKAAQATPNELLIRARLERGWTQKDVADRIGAPLNLNVNRWERGIAKPSAYYVQRLCEVFGKSASELGLLPPLPESKGQDTTTGNKAGRENSSHSSESEPERSSKEPPTGTITLLFIDMVESTRLLQQLGDDYTELLAGYRRIIRTTFGQYNGYEVDTQGDAFFFVFVRALDAITAAVALQRALMAHSWMKNVTVQARIGLHTGEPQLSSEGYVGLDVHHAARIMGAGHPGQILLSQTTHDLIQHALAQDMVLRDLGEHHLKDIQRPTHLFQVSCADLQTDFPPLKSLNIPLWNVPFRRNPFFTGRTSLLERLHEQLNQSQSAALTQSHALTGLGGIGKTQSAVEYAYRYCNEYSAVFWARAASRETLVVDYIAIARLLSLPGQDDQDQMQTVMATKRWLEQHGNWLLILDNADTLSLLFDFLPDTAHGHLLLTTRAQATGKIAMNLSVEKMEISEGMQLLLHRAKLLAPGESQDNLSATIRKAGQQLVKELDCLPLALDQAGAYIEETGCSLPEYLDLYQRHHSALLNRQSGLSADYPHTVTSTWSLSFQQVEQECPAAAELLDFCAFLDPDAIPETVLTEGADSLGPVLGAVASDPLLLNEAIQTLRRYSLIKRDPDTKILNVHRLVQVILKDGLDEGEKRLWAERTVCAVNAAFPQVSFETWQRCELCLPHAQACAALIDEYHFSFPQAIRLLHQVGCYLRDRGLYVQAEPLLLQAFKLYEQEAGSEDSDTASSLNDLAWLYYLQGKYEQAEPLLQRALTIREQVLGNDHVDTAVTLNNLAWLYMQQSRYTQAEPLYQRALAIREHVLGASHADTALTLNDIAMLYIYQGKYEQAEPLLQRALTIRKQVLGSSHPDVAESLNNLAMIHYYRSMYEQAEPLYQHALSIREQALGPEHHDTAQILNNLANLYRNQGKYAQAEPLLQRAVSIHEQALGPEHPLTAIVLLNLAQIYYLWGMYEKAEALYQRALSINEQALGPEHPETAFSLYSLANLYRNQGEYKRADSLYRRALVIFEQALGLDHPDTARAREDYAGMLHAMQEK